MYKTWKRLIVTLMLFSLIACGGGAEEPTDPDPTDPADPGPTEPGPAVPETVEAIRGAVAGWSAANGTHVHFASFSGNPPQYFSAPIDAEGAFSVTLTKPNPEQLQSFSFCRGAEDAPEFEAATISSGLVSSQAEPPGSVTGRIFLGNNYEFFFGDSSEASVGDRRTEWWYVDGEVAFSGECDDVSYAVKFEQGWNLYHTIVESVEGDTVTLKVETGPVPEDVLWTYVPEP